MSETRDNAGASSTDPPIRKPYHRPTLEVHGTIREVTEHVGTSSSNPDPPPHAGGRIATR